MGQKIFFLAVKNYFKCDKAQNSGFWAHFKHNLFTVSFLRGNCRLSSVFRPSGHPVLGPRAPSPPGRDRGPPYIASQRERRKGFRSRLAEGMEGTASGRGREEEDGCMQLGSVVVVLAVHYMHARGKRGDKNTFFGSCQL